MNLRREISLDFARRYQDLDWGAIDLGVREGWLRPRDAIAFAEHRVSNGSTSALETELAILTCDDLEDVPRLLSRLAEPSGASEPVRLCWMRILVARVHAERDGLEDPLGVIEQIYADFGHPREIRHLVRYEPGEFTLKPGETPEQRLMTLLRDYVEELAKRTTRSHP